MGCLSTFVHSVSVFVSSYTILAMFGRQRKAELIRGVREGKTIKQPSVLLATTVVGLHFMKASDPAHTPNLSIHSPSKQLRSAVAVAVCQIACAPTTHTCWHPHTKHSQVCGERVAG